MANKYMRKLLTTYAQSRIIFETKTTISPILIPKPVLLLNPNLYIKRKYSTLNFDEINKLRNTENICWKCRSQILNESKYFCSKCQTVLPINKNENYFSLFGMKKSFRISNESLQQKFKNLQGVLHPDKFTLKPATELEISQSISSQLNKAYFTLLKPLSRGLYMLKLEGVVLGEDVTADDPHFLMEIMELNEQVEDAKTITDLKEIQHDVKVTIDNLTLKIENSFTSSDVRKAKSCIISYKYYDNILVKLKEKIPPE